MSLKRQLFLANGVVHRELIDGKLVFDNIGKSPTELGFKLNVFPIGKTEQKEWPLWAKALKQFSVPEDKGIGDVVLRIIGDEKSEAFKAWFQKIFNRPCNCYGRLKQWNALYPLTTDAKPD